MTDKDWTKETYLKLEELVKKNASHEEIAGVLKIEKGNIPYRLKLLKQQKVIQTWQDGEIELLEKSKNLDDFARDCIKQFGKHRDNNIMVDHWMNRKNYLAAWKKEKDEKKKIHTIILPKPAITKPIQGEKRDSLPDVGDQMAILINRVTENKAILNEMLQVQKDTYLLFKDKLEGQKEVKNNVNVQ
jgi:hypothetical protein